ncbi:MAG: aminotransferase class I/II-fold pyridoxal phosphate-dependent enzyme, partial [Methanomicrobiales archaeon]|nr:aminotransferase class I/II-fold pyridoxal phosphate-dependent enzyme [Methanomicrobiales archaeon]
DEAFIELSDPAQSLVNVRHENLFIARSLTKSFAVPGIRFGYGFGSPALVSQMEARRLPWSINAFAEAFALQAFRQYSTLETSRLAIAQERSWIVTQLQGMGIRYTESKANFLLLHLPSPGKELEKRLLSRGIIIRDCASFGLPNAIRIAIRTREENKILMEGLQACLL